MSERAGPTYLDENRALCMDDQPIDMRDGSRRILVTGGAGFIGSHVVDLWVASGDRVVVIDDLSSGTRANVNASAELHVMDVKSADAADLVRDGRFDVIAHLAAQVDVRYSVADPRADLLTNAGGTLNLLEAIRSMPPARRPRIVFASTGGALYGRATRFPTAEDADINPDAPYGIAKLAAEHYLAYYGRIWNIDAAVVRFGNVYGPRQDSHGEAGVIAIFSQRLLEGRPLTVYGTGRQTRDYVYVSDVASAFQAASTKPLPPPGSLGTRAYNIGTAVETSVIELVDVLSAVSGKTPVVELAPARAGELDRSVLDPGKANRELGWRAEVSLRDGIARTYGWVANLATPAEGLPASS